jgi:integrase/recombinase XerD
MNRNPEYSFTKEILGQLKGFRNHLQNLGNSENTIRQKLNYAGYFLKWLEKEQLQPKEARYNDLLNFIDYCHLEGNSKRQINSKLRSIRNFYEYLKTTDKDLVNPASSLHVKGIRKTLPSGII